MVASGGTVVADAEIGSDKVTSGVEISDTVNGKH